MVKRSAQRTAGSLLKDWIERTGQKQQDVAGVLGISDGHLSLLISGRRTPSLTLAASIASRTGIPATAWVEGVAA